MSRADLGEISLEYEVNGAGEPIFLVMGLATQLVGWTDDFVQHLVDGGYRVIRMDNRDIGGSTKVDAPPPRRLELASAVALRQRLSSPYSLGDMADDLVQLMDYMGLDRVHAVGASMGGMIVQRLAIRHPDRVASITSIMSNTGSATTGRSHPALLSSIRKVLLRPLPEDEAEKVQALLAGWRLISGPHYDEAEMRGLVEVSLARDSDRSGRVRQLMAILTDPDRTDELRSVTAPALVIHGLLDQLVMPSGGIATAKAIPGSRLLMFPDMAHDIPKPRRAEIAAAIMANCARAPIAHARSVRPAG